MSLELLAQTSEFVQNAAVTEDKPFRCPTPGCNREFTSKRNLVDHFRGHHQGAKPHVCEYPGCGKSFLRPAHLLIHSRIHTGEKPFVCPFEGCGKRWNQKSALKQHLRSHTGEKPFVCTVEGCTKSFSTSSSCKRHIATHMKSGGVDSSHLASPYQSPAGAQPTSPKRKYHDEYDSCSSSEDGASYSSGSSQHGSSDDEANLSHPPLKRHAFGLGPVSPTQTHTFAEEYARKMNLNFILN